MDSIAYPHTVCQITDDPIPANTIEFLSTLYSRVSSGWLEITYIAPANSTLRPHIFTEWAEFPLHIQNTSLGHLHGINRRGYGIYFGCAVRSDYKDTGRGTQLDAACITTLWCDVDGVTPDEGYQRLISMELWPSIIVASGGGVHGYWLLNEPVTVDTDTLPRIRRLLHGIAIAAGEGGDTKVRDLARVMRLPGFINTKRNAPCEVLDCIPGCYDYADVQRVYGMIAPAEEQPLHRPAPPIAQRIEIPRWVNDYLTTGAGQGERNTRAYAAARALLDCGYSISETSAMITTRARQDGLSQREINTLLRSAEKAPRTIPNMPNYMRARMVAADHLRRTGKGE